MIFAFIIFIITLAPIMGFFSKDRNKKRKRLLNVILALLLLVVFSPLILAVIVGAPAHMYMYFTVPFGGLAILILLIFKLVYHQKYKALLHSNQ